MKIAGSPMISSGPDLPQDKSAKTVAHEFEGLLLNEVFKVMRQSVPESTLFGGFSSQVFNSMFDEQLSREAATTGSLGLSDMVMQQLDPSSTSTKASDPMGSRAYTPINQSQWVKPVDADVIHPSAAQSFGAARKGDRPAECGEGHCGLDLAPGEGTPVRAAANGVIKAIGRNLDSNGGLSVEVAHEGGRVVTRYLHLEDISPDLAVGTKVASGERIGSVGNTGRASHGAHLHFEIEQHLPDGSKKLVDPEPYVKMWPRAQKP